MEIGTPTDTSITLHLEPRAAFLVSALLGNAVSSPMPFAHWEQLEDALAALYGPASSLVAGNYLASKHGMIDAGELLSEAAVA